MSDHATPAEVATGFITAFGNRDLRAIASYLAEDVAFESPRVTLTGAAAVREAIGQFAQVVTGVNIMAVLGDAESAAIIYEMVTGPFGTLRAADYLQVRGGKIISDVLIFDTYEVRTAQDG